MNMAPPTLLPPYDEVYRQLVSFIPESRVISDPLRTLAYGTDASFYRLTPKLVVEVADEKEVVRTLRLAGDWNTPVTFRAAGTSLSGQAVTDSILRSGKTTPTEVKDYMLSKDFNLEGYKRIALNFRPWDHQMRQPIILGGTRVPVSTSPQEGFLHQTYTTDTLGYDKPETKCKFK